MRKRSGWLRQTGFQLAELLISIFVFSLVSGICFYAASSAFRLFANVQSRQSLQNDARAVSSWLQRDLSTSNLMRCQQLARDYQGSRRDALAAVTMSSWQQPVAKDPLSLPNWDRVVVYLATEEESGKLIRQSLKANGSPPPIEAPQVMTMLSDVVNNAFPPSQLAGQQLLSSNIKSFSVDIQPASNSVAVDLILSQLTVQGGSGQARKETLEIHTTVGPHNTWPRL